MGRKAIVIGAGIGGLATAVRLAVAGYAVEVYEAAAYPGGKLSEFEMSSENGGLYRFDAGPSLFTRPELVTELFELAKVPIEQHFSYIRLEDICHYFYPDGKRFVAPALPQDLAAVLETNLGEPKQNTIDYLASAEHKYNTVADLFLTRSLHQWKTWTSKKAFASYFQIPFLDLMTTMDKVHQRSFKTAEARQLFNRYATYNGSDPYQTPGLLTLIPHLECQMGAYFPTEGMYSITLSVTQLAKRLGVQFNFNCNVDEILHDADKVIGIRLGENDIFADVVVSNLDIHPTYHKLLPKLKKPEQVLNQQRSSSALIFYWGISKSFPQLGLHNILFSADYKEEFKHLFQLGTISDDPTLYINISSKYKPDDAPTGHENWFMMINVPNNTNKQDWDQLIGDARTAILAKASKMLGEDIASLITCEQVLEPRTIESKTGSYQGSLYGNSSNSPMAAFFRHNNKHEDIKGLYFVGGSVHPGGGIPLALSSAKIVADLVEGI